ncbi:MAG: nitrate- and nitrite sensing domain-containing protein, partial [Magnetococcus sp. WYHC-3]
MNLLQRVSLRTQFVVMLLVPLAGLIWFGMEGVWSKHLLVGKMEDMAQLSTFAVRVSALVHETQRERGMTAGFLGSKGQKFRNELAEQRPGTETQSRRLRDTLAGFDPSRFGRALAEPLANAMRRLDDLSAVRQRVDNLQITGPEAIAHYTDMNSDFLRATGEIAQLSVAELSPMASSYVHFLLAKERAGIERAVLSNTFAADRFGPGMYRRFGELVSEQDTYLQMFQVQAPASQVAYFRSQMQ